MKIGDTLYLVNHSKCEIIIGTYDGLNLNGTFHLINKHEKKNGKTILFTADKSLDINPTIADEESFWKRLNYSCNLKENAYLIFDNEKQALEVFKTFVVPLHIKAENQSSEQTRAKYMAHIERVDVLEKMLLCNTIVN